MSVPDSDMLISISEALETPVDTLLGETVIETEVDNIKAISEKLAVIIGNWHREKIREENLFIGFLFHYPPS